MSDIGESESDLDFSASEDEYMPTDEVDSENESEDDDDDNNGEEEETIIYRTSKKKTTNKRKPQQRHITRKQSSAQKVNETQDDSDSSVENYLVNPSEIDLASDFFNPNKVVTSDVPNFDCNIGLNLSDSDEEVFEEVATTSQNAAAKLLDFGSHTNFNKELENAKNQLRNFKSTNFGHDSAEVDVTKLLAMGEPALVAAKSSHSKRRKDLISTDESDFEEVEEDIKTENRNDVEVHIGPVVKQKPNKLQAEIEASIKRKINRRTKENQLVMHKVHLLSWIAYGNFVNKVLNSTKLMEMVLKYIPSDKCYPKEQTDQQYFEQITKWFKTTVGLKNKEQNCSLKCLPPIATSLALQIQSKMAICKKDFVFIFIILLRSIGIQCRLVINLATVPMRPPAKDLCVISTKSEENSKKKVKKGVKESSNEKSKKDAKNSKVKPKAPSHSAQKSEASKKSVEAPKQINSLKSKIEAALNSDESRLNSPTDVEKRKLKRRSVSVQQMSSINDNTKRSRVTRSKDTKTSNIAKAQNGEGTSSTNEGSKKISKLRSLSLHSIEKSPDSIDSSLISFSYRPKRAVATKGSTSSATITSQSIPQLDGGDDRTNKKAKPELFKLKFPLRSRSVSPTSSSNPTQKRSKSVAMVSPRSKRSKTKLLNIKVPRSTSKSPASTSGRISRKTETVESTSNRASRQTKTSSSKSVIKQLPMSNAETEVDSLLTKNVDTRDEKMGSSATKVSKNKSSSEHVVPSTSKEKPKPISKTKKQPTSKESSLAETSKKPDNKSSSPSKPVVPSNTKEESNLQSVQSVEKSLKNGASESQLAKVGSSARKVSKRKLSTNEVDSKRTSTNAQKTKTIVAKRKAIKSASSDSDFAPTPNKKLSPATKKPSVKQVENLKKRIDRRILSTDDESIEPSVRKDDMNFWIEVYSEADRKWICVDVFNAKVNCVDEVKKKATKPIAYVFAWNNNNKMKDVSPRYCSQWNTTTRKLRVEPEWLDTALRRYKEPLSQRCVAEDRELEEIHAQTPIPKSISELKNHPLYVLPRHLLKFEGIYPPNPVPVGYIRDEPIYSRLCVYTLHSREIWVKQARVVKVGEIPYKIVKARPKWDRLANKMLEPQPLEIFGHWQTEPFVPPTAENGIVPRNAYGNVELFKPEMLPKKTVHLRLAGLNRVCAKLKIDCAQAVVGFDFHGGSSHPTFDGFVVCEEFAELVTERWCEEQEESYRKSKEKQTSRIYANWKKLIRGLLIRERLQRKYDFAGKDASASSSKKK